MVKLNEQQISLAEEKMDSRHDKLIDIIIEFLRTRESDEENGISPIIHSILTLFSIHSALAKFFFDYYKDFPDFCNVKEFKELANQIDTRLSHRVSPMLRDISSGFIAVDRFKKQNMSTKDIIEDIENDENLKKCKSESDEIVMSKTLKIGEDLISFLESKKLEFWNVFPDTKKSRIFLKKEDFQEWQKNNPEEKYKYLNVDFSPSIAEVFRAINHVLRACIDSIDQILNPFVPDIYKINDKTVPDFKQLLDMLVKMTESPKTIIGLEVLNVLKPKKICD